MASRVGIFNVALGWCRADAVVSPEEDSAAARSCRRYYDGARDAVLRAYPWNCATRRAHLAALSPPPPFGFDQRYRLPDDCLTVRAIWGAPDAPWQIEGRELLTNVAAPLPIVYTARLDDESLFDPSLAAAVAARLAWDMASTLIDSQTAMDALEARYRRTLQEARQTDAAEGQLPQPDDATSLSWLEDRL
ncbi:hypothetical protein [Azospirillum sp. sgz302134]